jgi:hypothetical protein
MAPSSQELEPPQNPGRFTYVFGKVNDKVLLKRLLGTEYNEI